MGRNAIQFQRGLSVPDFQKLYGTEALCEEALAQMRWPCGFRCPRCAGAPHGFVYGRRLKRYQSRQCGHQATVTAGTTLEATKLPLFIWFFVLDQINQAISSIYSLQFCLQFLMAHNTA